MALSKFDIEKNKALKLGNDLKQTGIPSRFAAANAVPDRREQRKIDQALGLVPFACKLNGELVKQLEATALERGVAVNTLLAEFVIAGLAAK